jgi:hypothetical protein
MKSHRKSHRFVSIDGSLHINIPPFREGLGRPELWCGWPYNLTLTFFAFDSFAILSKAVTT